MDKDNILKEEKCLQSKYLIDLLRTNLFMLDLPNYKLWETRLKKLKSQVDSLYWEL